MLSDQTVVLASLDLSTVLTASSSGNIWLVARSMALDLPINCVLEIPSVRCSKLEHVQPDQVVYQEERT